MVLLIKNTQHNYNYINTFRLIDIITLFYKISRIGIIYYKIN